MSPAPTTKRRHSISSTTNPPHSSPCCCHQNMTKNSTQIALELCRLSVQDDDNNNNHTNKSTTTTTINTTTGPHNHSYYPPLPPSPSSSCSSPSQNHHHRVHNNNINNSSRSQPAATSAPPPPTYYNKSGSNKNHQHHHHHHNNRPRSSSVSTRPDFACQQQSLVPTLLYPYGYLSTPYITYPFPNNWWFPPNNNNGMLSYIQPNDTNTTGNSSNGNNNNASTSSTNNTPNPQHQDSSSPPQPLVYNCRRMPYSLGADLLDLPAPVPGKESLSTEDDAKLTSEIMKLFTQLLPSDSSNQKRQGFLRKVEAILLEAWPEKDISLHTFGSTESLLASSESDLDVCIMTRQDAHFQNVNALCSLLVSKGMKRILCIPTARVPIVRIWDPEFQLSCDLNFNHPQALENTRLIRTYMLLDDRVRPLAMTIKYWTKRRLLNNAAFGGTLSSYTWLCMIINFLQTLKPHPILPSLQMEHHVDKLSHDGIHISFCDDVDRFSQFTKHNNSSVGKLFFDFFKFYGYQFDYSNLVLSVRQGKHIPKREKGWHLVQNNQLGVEEPFDTSRNLGNTADDISIKGIQLEFQRVYKIFSEKIDLDACLEEYRPPPDPIHRRSEPQPSINNQSRPTYNRNDHHAAFLPIMYPMSTIPWGVDYSHQLLDNDAAENINNPYQQQQQQQPMFGYYPNATTGWYMPFANVGGGGSTSAASNPSSPHRPTNGYYWNSPNKHVPPPAFANPFPINTTARRYNGGPPQQQQQSERGRKSRRARSSLSSSPRQIGTSDVKRQQQQQQQQQMRRPESCRKASTSSSSSSSSSSGGYIMGPSPHFSADESDDVDSFDLSPRGLLPHTPPMEEDDVVGPSVKSYASVAGINTKKKQQQQAARQSERSRSCSTSSNSNISCPTMNGGLRKPYWGKSLQESHWDKGQDDERQQQQHHHHQSANSGNKNNKWSVSMSRRSRKQHYQNASLPVAAPAAVHDETIKGG